MDTHDRKRIALVSYAPDYFWAFSRELEAVGFTVYWITDLRSSAWRLVRKYGVPEDRVLDLTHAFDSNAEPIDAALDDLARLELREGPRIKDVIQMDRLLHRKPYRFAVNFLAHVQRVTRLFLERHQIELVVSGRDTAQQLTIMLLSRTLGVPWVVPTRARIPQEMYGFCEAHWTTDLIPLRDVTPDDRAWAERFLDEFETRDLRPVLKKATRSGADVWRLLPEHLRLFSRALVNARWDCGNDYSRYTIPRLIRMYFTRRMRLLVYKTQKPYQPPAGRPFCLYALHTQPESSIDVSGSYFSDQVGLIRLIARSLPATHDLYVKVHPTDVDGKSLSYYREIASIHGVRLINYDVNSRELLRRTSLVFSITGTIGYEAGLMGKPVITFAPNYFNGLPTVYHCETPPALPRLVDQLLGAEPGPAWRAEVLRFLADLRRRCFDGEVNRVWFAENSTLTPDDLRRLGNAYTTLHRLLRERLSQRTATGPVAAV